MNGKGWADEEMYEHLKVWLEEGKTQPLGGAAIHLQKTLAFYCWGGGGVNVGQSKKRQSGTWGSRGLGESPRYAELSL